jgi:glycosyltransferase involved in cell wall biosynthesis
MSTPFVSVVVATRDRAGLLAQTLDALAGQRWPRDQFEIVVADNGSTDGTRAVIEAFAARQAAPVTRYLHVAEPGKSLAVNAALQHARGDLLAWTDDDVLPETTWIEHLAAAFEDPGVDFVAGRILPRWEIPPPPWMSRSLHGVLAIPDNGVRRLTIDAEHPQLVPIGANMAVRSAVIRRLGGLRADLGKLAGTLRTGEDHEFFLRMLRAGCRGLYEPGALVRHWVARDRLKPSYFRRWLYQNGRDVARLESAYASCLPTLLRAPRYLWRQAGSDAARIAQAVLARNERQRVAAVLRLIWFGGYLREAWSGTTTAPSGDRIALAEER